MRLSTQIISSMLIAVFCVGLLVGEAVRYFETNRLERVIEERAQLTMALLGGLMTEAIIVEDAPVIDTALEETVKSSPAIVGIFVSNEDGKIISKFPSKQFLHKKTHSVFTQDVDYEGDVFGSITVHWSNVQEKLQIEQSVLRARIYAGVTMAALTGLFVFLMYKLVLKPLNVVHGRMAATMRGDRWSKQTLSKLAAREFLSLADSVTTLDKVLTERTQREEALTAARRNADAASRSKSEFLANMSHEIRTPMNGVIGMAELMLETELDRDQHLYTETIVKSGSALLTIINDILDFSKIEAGKMTLETEPFNLHRALEDILQLVATKAAQNSVEVSLRYDPELPTTFDGDAGRIRQIITNIIGNAVKFTHKGQVIVNATGVRKGETYNLEISITDTGVGIPEDNLNSIFQEFEQVDGAATRKFEGTGLGLAISTRLTRMMGGNIAVQSKTGIGSTFTVKIPLLVNRTFVEPEYDVEADLTGKRVLIVDDLEINRTILSEQLRNWKADYQTACSAREALEILTSDASRTLPFDLAILDFQMPETDGLQLAKSIRNTPGLASLPMILLSSVEQTAEVRAQKDLGFSEILMKPARSVILKSAISTALKIERGVEKKPVPMVDSGSEAVSLRDGLKILIAEDNKTNQLVVRMMLKKTAVKMKFANDGGEARDIFMTFRPDITLMDMSMPIMDGLEATRAIRLLEAELGLPRCPIIALTANAMMGDRERCLSAGMDDYLSKPIVKSKLLEAVSRWQDLGHTQFALSENLAQPPLNGAGGVNGLAPAGDVEDPRSNASA